MAPSCPPPARAKLGSSRSRGAAGDYPIADATPRILPAINGWFSRLDEAIASVGTIAPLSLPVLWYWYVEQQIGDAANRLGESHLHPTTIWKREKP